jgi:hypothetical protein
MKICNFCGYRTDDNSVKACTSCGSKQFSYVCPNCSAEFEGKFCPTCGTRYDAVAKICPECGEKYFTKSCPDCGYNPNAKVYTRQTVSDTTWSTGRQSGYTSPAHRSAVTALVLSIVGMITCMPLLTIIGLVMAIMGNKKDDVDDRSRGINKTTISLSIVILIFCVLAGILYVIGMGLNLINSR